MNEEAQAVMTPVEAPTATAAPAETKKRGRKKLTEEELQKRKAEREKTKTVQKAESQKARVETYRNEYDKEENDRLMTLVTELSEMKEEDITHNHMTALALLLIRDGSKMSVPALAQRYNDALQPKYHEKMKASLSSDPSRKDKDGKIVSPGFGLRNKIWEGQHGTSKYFSLTGGQLVKNTVAHSNHPGSAPRARLQEFSLLGQTRANINKEKALIDKVCGRFFKAGSY